MTRGFLRTFLIPFCASVFVPLIGYTQIGDPGEDPGVPLTGIEWLLAAGGALGARRIYQRFKKP